MTKMFFVLFHFYFFRSLKVFSPFIKISVCVFFNEHGHTKINCLRMLHTAVINCICNNRTLEHSNWYKIQLAIVWVTYVTPIHFPQTYIQYGT
jgi:hypothetical protein